MLALFQAGGGGWGGGTALIAQQMGWAHCRSLFGPPTVELSQQVALGQAAWCCALSVKVKQPVQDIALGAPLICCAAQCGCLAGRGSRVAFAKAARDPFFLQAHRSCWLRTAPGSPRALP